MTSGERAAASVGVSVDVSIIVPAYDAAATISEQLDALRRQQTSRRFEVIVVDNGSGDRTRQIVDDYSDMWVALRLVDASGRRGSAHARNVGAKQARGRVLAFCDADDIVEAGWLDAIADPVIDGRIVFGSLRVDSINDTLVTRWRATPAAALPLEPGPTSQSFAPSGNMAITRATYLELGGMNEDYPKSHDVEFSLRARAHGVELYAAPDAVVHYRYRSTMRGAFRQSFRSGRAAAQMYAQFRDPSTKRDIGATGRSWWWLFSRLPLLVSRARRGLWIASLGIACGQAVGSVRYRVWYF